MVKYFLFLILLLIFQSACDQGKRIWEDKDWETLEKKAAAYFSDPSPNNESDFYKALPRKKIEKLPGDILKLIFRNENLEVITQQIHKENRKVIEIVYRLFLITDAGYTEILIVILNELIYINPSLYLEKLKAHHDNEVKKIGGLFVCYTANLNSEEEALIEINQRIEALKRVKDKKLIEIRDRCIEELKGCKNTYENIIKEAKIKNR